MLPEQNRAQIKLEIEQINQLLTTYSDLVNESKKQTPNTVEIAALASVLHSFYNGIESIFLTLVKSCEERVPVGNHWHRDLLVQMTFSTKKRRAVISKRLAKNLGQYLGFRHFFRHSYSFFLDWGKLRNLVVHLPEIWVQLKDRLERFINAEYSKNTE